MLNKGTRPDGTARCHAKTRSCASPATMQALRSGASWALAKSKASQPRRQIAQAQAGGSIWSSAVSGVKRTLSSDAYIQGAKSGLPQDNLLEKLLSARLVDNNHRDIYRDVAQKFIWTYTELAKHTKSYAVGWNNAPILPEHKFGVVLRNESENVRC